MSGCFVGRTDERLELQCLSEVVDPTGGPAGLHDDPVGFVAFEDGADRSLLLRDAAEFGFTRFGVENAAGRVEFADVQCENPHCVYSECLVGGKL